MSDFGCRASKLIDIDAVVLNINDANVWHTISYIRTRLQNPIGDFAIRRNNLRKGSNRVAVCILNRVSKHLQKDRLRQAVEQVERAFALAAKRVRLVQDRRNPPLLAAA